VAAAACAVFAGALRYPRYRWYDRFMIRLIMKMTGGETDTVKKWFIPTGRR
jgi:menaquinone-dependent protoporphyrinogen oxidase